VKIFYTTKKHIDIECCVAEHCSLLSIDRIFQNF